MEDKYLGLPVNEAARMARHKAECAAYDSLPNHRHTVYPKFDLLKPGLGARAWDDRLPKL